MTLSVECVIMYLLSNKNKKMQETPLYETSLEYRGPEQGPRRPDGSLDFILPPVELQEVDSIDHSAGLDLYDPGSHALMDGGVDFPGYTSSDYGTDTLDYQLALADMIRR